MSSISPTELYLEMRTDPTVMERLYGETHADNIAAVVYEFASAKGHQVEMSEIFDGLWDSQNIVNGAVAENTRNDHEIKLALWDGVTIGYPANDELSDDELEMVAGGAPEGCTMPKGCPEGCRTGKST